MKVLGHKKLYKINNHSFEMLSWQLNEINNFVNSL